MSLRWLTEQIMLPQTMLRRGRRVRQRVLEWLAVDRLRVFDELLRFLVERRCPRRYNNRSYSFRFRVRYKLWRVVLRKRRKLLRFWIRRMREFAALSAP